MMDSKRRVCGRIVCDKIIESNHLLTCKRKQGANKRRDKQQVVDGAATARRLAP